MKKAFSCFSVLMLASGMLLAQASPQMSHTKDSGKRIAPRQSGLAVIFSNLGPTATNDYFDASGYNVDGPSNSSGLSEQWIAIPFTPKANSHVSLIEAPIGYIAGTSEVVLSLYSDAGGLPGSSLASGNTTSMPAFGTCCSLASVNITSTAVTKGTQYWIVGSSDDTNAPDFYGAWMASNEANIGYNLSVSGWNTFNGNVPAVSVQGTIP